MYNRLAATSRSRYEKVVNEFGGFLLIHNKSLWDADFEDLKKFLLEEKHKGARSIISTFYRVLIDSGQFKGENPVIQLNKIESEQRSLEQSSKLPPTRAESVLQELEDEDTKSSKQTKLAATSRRKIGKRIMTLVDLDELVQRANHIRDRAILEYLYATGSQIQETVNLNVADVDLESRKVTIHDNSSDNFRILILARRTVNFLKIYERWRRRQMSPSQAYFITKTTRRRMSDSSISTWLNRIQNNVSDLQRWTAMDFRKRALLQHYWVTRDLTAVARFGGYKRPESALNLISDILADQGVDSIDKLASLPEFEALKSDKRTASVTSGDQLTITIQLDREEMDIIRNSGLTPTQAVKTIISLKDLYGAFGGGGGVRTSSSGSPVSSTESSQTDTNLKASPSGGPNLTVSPSGGPNLKVSPSGGPNLKASPTSNSPNSVNLKSSPTGTEPPKKLSPPPGGGPGPMSQLNELKSILERRRKMSEEKPEDESETGPKPAGLGAKIEDSSPISSEEEIEKKDDDEEKEEDLPDFNL